MTQISLTPEQTAVLASASGPVVLVDANGNRVGHLALDSEIVFSPERIAEAKRRLETETGGVTTAELLKKLAALGDS